MNSTNKVKTIIEKFEGFISNTYKDEVFEILENYPDKRSVIVDYNDLERFDPDLADLLIDKPEEVIVASQIAIKKYFKEDVDLNIRFKNLTNTIPMNKISSKYINTLICINGLIIDLKDIF